MKNVRSTLVAAAVLAGLPSIGLAQPPEDGGRGRPMGSGRFQRGPDAQPGAQFQAQPRQDFGGRPNFRTETAQPQTQLDGQRPQGFGRDPARLAQDGRGGTLDRPLQANARDDDRRFIGGQFNGGQFNNGRFNGGQFNNGQFGNRGPGTGGRFDDGNRFRGDDRRFDGNRYGGNDNRFGNFDRYSGGNRFQPDWRNDRRYDWRGYRNDNRQLFRAPRYVPPRSYGFGYRPFARGYQLQPFFYGSNYWISDPWQYRLPPAYGPYRWVRYYNDVLLVDIDTGFVLDVIQNFFW